MSLNLNSSDKDINLNNESIAENDFSLKCNSFVFFERWVVGAVLWRIP